MAKSPPFYDEPGSNNSPDLLSVAQTAKLLDVTRQRVHDLIKNGQIIARKLGRYYYIEAVELERYKNQPTGKPYQPRSTNSQEYSIDN
jgi:excisionase family DNA binding protein